MLNFTPLEIFAVRRAKYKLPLMLSLSIITIGTYFSPSRYSFTGIGTVVYVSFFLITLVLTRKGEEENSVGMKYSSLKYLYVLMGIVTIVLNFLTIGLVYKNYQNSKLGPFLANTGLNLVFDNFVVRPTLIFILAFPFSYNNSISSFVSECEE